MVLYFTVVSFVQTTYIAVILTHRLGVFRRMFAPAEHNLRLVLLNTRDYPGSSPYTEDDLSIMTSGGFDRQETFIRDQGHEIATFLLEYIRATNIPPYRTSDEGEGVPGGLVLLAWSMGNLFTMSMLGNAMSFPEDTQTTLHKYLRMVVLHGTFCRHYGTCLQAYHIYERCFSPQSRCCTRRRRIPPNARFHAFT